MNATQRNAPNLPDFEAYVITKQHPRDKGYWTKIGAAWKHGDGAGFNIVLSALPVGGEIVLRTPTPETSNTEGAGTT